MTATVAADAATWPTSPTWPMTGVRHDAARRTSANPTIATLHAVSTVEHPGEVGNEDRGRRRCRGDDDTRSPTNAVDSSAATRDHTAATVYQPLTAGCGRGIDRRADGDTQHDRAGGRRPPGPQCVGASAGQAHRTRDTGEETGDQRRRVGNRQRVEQPTAIPTGNSPATRSSWTTGGSHGAGARPADVHPHRCHRERHDHRPGAAIATQSPATTGTRDDTTVAGPARRGPVHSRNTRYTGTARAPAHAQPISGPRAPSVAAAPPPG